MRHLDNGKWGRHKASSLCDEFTAKGVEDVFTFHQQNNDNEKERKYEHPGQTQGAAGLGDFSSP